MKNSRKTFQRYFENVLQDYRRGNFQIHGRTFGSLGKQCQQNISLFLATANVFATFASSVQTILL